MTFELEQIRSLYESGVTPELIAEDRGLDLLAVKAGLMQCSRQYRIDIGTDTVDADGKPKRQLDFTEDDLEMANQGIRKLALCAEDETLKFKALTYIRDDKKGRKEVVKALGGSQINILQINNMLKSAREGANKAKQLLSSNGAIEA